MNDIDTIAQGFSSALRDNAPYAAPSLTRALSGDEAHAVQRAFNSLRTEPPIGFKSAANAQPLQTALGLSGPITGALFATGERAAGSTIRRADYRTLLVETELGFRAARRIDTPVKSIPELRAATTTCTPMIELADPGFDRARMTGTDLIAANSASAGFIRGRAVGLGAVRRQRSARVVQARRRTVARSAQRRPDGRSVGSVEVAGESGDRSRLRGRRWTSADDRLVGAGASRCARGDTRPSFRSWASSSSTCNDARGESRSGATPI